MTEKVRHTAEEALRGSDLLLFVVDAKEGLSPIDEDLARTLRRSRKPIVLVVNKIDNEKHEPLAAEFDSLGFDRSISISAEHNRGTSELLDQIERVFGFKPPRTHGHTVVDALQAMIDGRAKVFVGLGGNFIAAVPDKPIAEAAMRRLRLSVAISSPR